MRAAVRVRVFHTVCGRSRDLRAEKTPARQISILVLYGLHGFPGKPWLEPSCLVSVSVQNGVRYAVRGGRSRHPVPPQLPRQEKA